MGHRGIPAGLPRPVASQRLMWKRLSPPRIREHTIREMNEIVRGLNWDYGVRSKTLERRIARDLKVDPEWVIITASCTAALQCATHFLLNDRASVRVCPLTYAATYAPVANEKLPIEWVDCDDEGWPVGEVDIGVELWGRPFEFTGEKWPTVLDSAHKFGAPYHGELLREGKVQAITYSFNCQKEISGIHGGALVSPHVREEWRSWLFCGTKDRMPVSPGGIKGYLQEPLVYIVAENLLTLRTARKKRREVLEAYHEFLGNYLMTTPELASGHLAVVRVPDEGHALAVKNMLKRHGVEWSIHYMVNPETNCPNALDLSKRIVTIPCHTYMNGGDARRIAKLIGAA
jgi:dTDP-4-amino-4,6-dideoxygalactose transaminase